MGEIERMDKVSELIGEPSWADAIAAIDKADDLRPEQKRHLSTSLRQMAAYLDKPLSMIPTRIAAVGPAVKKLHPARARREPKDLRQSPGQCQDGAALVQPTDARLRPHIIDGAALSIATGEGAEPLRVGHAVALLSLPVCKRCSARGRSRHPRRRIPRVSQSDEFLNDKHLLAKSSGQALE